MENEITSIENDAEVKLEKKKERRQRGGGVESGPEKNTLSEYVISERHVKADYYACFVYEPTRRAADKL